MGWLRVVDSLKLYVSFAKEPYKRDDILQKRPEILRSLLIEATPCIWRDEYTRPNVSLYIYVNIYEKTNTSEQMTHKTPIYTYMKRPIHETKSLTSNSRTHARSHTGIQLHTYSYTHICARTWLRPNCSANSTNLSVCFDVCVCACVRVCARVCRCKWNNTINSIKPIVAFAPRTHAHHAHIPHTHHTRTTHVQRNRIPNSRTHRKKGTHETVPRTGSLHDHVHEPTSSHLHKQKQWWTITERNSNTI